MVKPIIKWVGGKTQIIQQVLTKFPKQIENYYEPFCGGGSVFLNLLEHDIIIKNIYINDINITLINMYKDIQNNPYELLNKINEHIKIFNGAEIHKKENKTRDGKDITNPKSFIEAKKYKKTYYYWLRNQYNNMEECLEKSSLFII